jgi:hypothetical protein
MSRECAGAVLSCALTVLSCSDSPLPGNVLGTYKVVGQPSANTCGSGLAAPSPWTFAIQASERGATLYWSYMDGTPPLSGTLVTSTQASLTTSQVANVDGSDAGAGPCWLKRDDRVDVALGAGSPPTSFQGTVTYTFSIPTNSSCTDQLSSAGGQYDTLPCAVRYAVTGTRQ